MERGDRDSRARLESRASEILISSEISTERNSRAGKVSRCYLGARDIGEVRAIFLERCGCHVVAKACEHVMA